jgi:hypothetical protein
MIPLLRKIGGFAGSYHVLGKGAVLVCWTVEEGKVLSLAANLSDDSTDNFPGLKGDLLWHEGPERAGNTMRPWSVRWFVGNGVCE